ncbi:MAG: CinA family protein [Planctomycetota bacterium]
MCDKPNAVAVAIVDQLQTVNHRLVLAESCTCGAAAAMLGGVAGASNVLCGSLVTYRQACKQDWLDVPKWLLDQYTAESLETTEAMAQGALAETPDATLAAAITGHLGPNCPATKDGRIFIAMQQRGQNVRCTSQRLSTIDRMDRQREAAIALLQNILDHCTASK